VGSRGDARLEVFLHRRVHAAAHGEILVAFFKNGGLIDRCDDWDLVTDVDRDAAVTCAIDGIIANPAAAQAAGVDPQLIEEIWR
jgi:hypothetical protein